ncbi:SipW-dependent-type signal peptide-containing protein [Alkaliphilus pronyensis]|uniref:SipW-dependent-type signal peptide-containing protein n=1 Tax=Alkaliphilus pronyensis TaxID=1482732 RepID=UPI00186584B6|nr:SipW-dependent-type signal peptide-containing protein [Alkaliphilus pronyensis]
MKNKIIFSVLTIVIAAAMIAGGTMAWFTSTADAGETTFTAGTVKIEADQVVNIPEEEVHEWTNDNIFPKWVVEAQQGQRYDGEDVVSLRSDPNAVLSLESGRNEKNFFSLGFGGEIEVEFSHIILAGEEFSVVTVVEDTWGRNHYPEEKADVYVSKNREDWILIGTATNQPSSQGNQITSTFTLPETVDYAKFIKLIDVSEREDFKNDQDISDNDRNAADGYDVNAIYVKGGYKDKDHNWNPGDTSTKKYNVENTGTKDIHVRAKLIGNWYQYNEETYQWEEFTPDHGDKEIDVITITVCDDSDWFYDEATDYYYYDGYLGGTYQREDNEVYESELCVEIKVDGEDTDNQYQGKRYVISTVFEAIQASNNAAAEDTTWGVDFFKR